MTNEQKTSELIRACKAQASEIERDSLLFNYWFFANSKPQQ